MTETLDDILRRQVSARPAAVAICALDGSELTYEALRVEMSAMATRLRAAGFGPNDRIAVALPNGPEMAIAVLGACCAGQCAPLNPASTQTEHRSLLAQLNASAVVVPDAAQSNAREAAAELGLPVIEFARGGAGDGELRMAAPSDIALVLHTSGTTARPKLVPLSHANLWASARNVVSSLQLKPSDRCLNVMPLFHVHGLVGALLASLFSGGTTICTAGFDADRFADWMESLRPTWYTAVPTIHYAVVSALKARQEVSERSSLRVVRSCSSALAPSLHRELESVLRVPVVEAYGMTEAAHQITSNALDAGRQKPGSVGRPVGTEIEIIDRNGKIGSTGSHGEIVIRGDNVFRGYEYGEVDPGETFVDGWLRTGDEGYVDGDGDLFIRGRIKELINRGGEKIAPREIDEALADHPAIAEVAAFGIPHATLGEDVAVAMVPRPGKEITLSSVRDYLVDRLADFKIPRAILLVDRLPKTASGKLDRTGLARTFSTRVEPGSHSAPADEAGIVSAIFAAVLELDTVSLRDNFFGLGGDSVRANMVLARIEAEFAIRLPVIRFFQAPTVEGVTAWLNENLSTSGAHAER